MYYIIFNCCEWRDVITFLLLRVGGGYVNNTSLLMFSDFICDWKFLFMSFMWFDVLQGDCLCLPWNFGVIRGRFMMRFVMTFRDILLESSLINCLSVCISWFHRSSYAVGNKRINSSVCIKLWLHPPSGMQLNVSSEFVVEICWVGLSLLSFTINW